VLLALAALVLRAAGLLSADECLRLDWTVSFVRPDPHNAVGLPRALAGRREAERVACRGAQRYQSAQVGLCALVMVTSTHPYYMDCINGTSGFKASPRQTRWHHGSPCTCSPRARRCLPRWTARTGCRKTTPVNLRHSRCTDRATDRAM
jgi:hypothetical protein